MPYPYDQDDEKFPGLSGLVSDLRARTPDVDSAQRQGPQLSQGSPTPIAQQNYIPSDYDPEHAGVRPSFGLEDAALGLSGDALSGGLSGLVSDAKAVGKGIKNVAGTDVSPFLGEEEGSSELSRIIPRRDAQKILNQLRALPDEEYNNTQRISNILGLKSGTNQNAPNMQRMFELIGQGKLDAAGANEIKPQDVVKFMQKQNPEQFGAVKTFVGPQDYIDEVNKWKKTLPGYKPLTPEEDAGAFGMTHSARYLDKTAPYDHPIENVPAIVTANSDFNSPVGLIGVLDHEGGAQGHVGDYLKNPSFESTPMGQFQPSNISNNLRENPKVRENIADRFYKEKGFYPADLDQVAKYAHYDPAGRTAYKNSLDKVLNGNGLASMLSATQGHHEQYPDNFEWEALKNLILRSK